MIVICTKCQAKFRVADQKIGARGAKVRCSKCQTVFRVFPDGATPAEPAGAAGAGLELEPAPAAAPPIANPFLASPARWDPTQPDLSPPTAREAPPPLPPPLPGSPSPDPLAAAAFPGLAAAPSRDPFAPAPPDPFAPAAPDPFAPAAPDPFASAATDPFAPAAAPDPFAGGTPAAAFPDAQAPAASAHATDLAALLGAAAPGAPPPPLPAAGTDGGLALEDRPAEPPKPASSAPFELGLAGEGAFPAAGDAQPFDPGALELGPAAEVPPLAGPSPAAELAFAPPQAAAPAPRGVPRCAGALPIAAPAGYVHERIPGRPSRLRAVAVNAVSLAALLVVAVAILALSRAEGPADAGALRPSSILSALRRGGGGAPFAAREVRSGLYERDGAPPVLFVRGSVVSRAPAPVPRVRVRVEIIRAGAVVSSGEAIAGAVPTPEELWRAHDAAALVAATAAAKVRAPAQVRPGDTVPFLVAIADHPADLAGASLRVEAAPAGGPAP